MKVVFFFLIFTCYLQATNHYRYLNQNVDDGVEASLRRIDLKDRLHELEDLVDTHQHAHVLYKKDAEEMRQRLQDEYSRYQLLQHDYSDVQRRKEEREYSLNQKIQMLEVRLRELEGMEDVLVEERDVLRTKIEKDLKQCLMVNGHEAKQSHQQYVQMQKFVDDLYKKLQRSEDICSEKLNQAVLKYGHQKENAKKVAKKLKNIKKVVLELQRQKKNIQQKEKENVRLCSDLHQSQEVIKVLQHKIVDIDKETVRINQELELERERMKKLQGNFKNKEIKLREMVELLQEERDRAREALPLVIQKEMDWNEQEEQLHLEVKRLRSENQQLKKKNLSLEMKKIDLKTRINHCENV